jgi:hypothetical protein
MEAPLGRTNVRIVLKRKDETHGTTGAHGDGGNARSLA